MPPPPSCLQHENQNRQQHNERHDRRDACMVPRVPRKPIELPPRSSEGGRRPIDVGVNVLEKVVVRCELVTNLEGEVMLAGNGGGEVGEAVVLV